MAEPADADLVADLAGDFEPATHDQWLAMAEKALRGRPIASLDSRTCEGITVHPLYTDGPDERTTGAPGASPFIRGFTADQRDGGRWDIRVRIDGAPTDGGAPNGDRAQSSGSASVAASELEGGATSLLVGGAALADEAALRSALEGVHLDLAPVVLEPASGYLSCARWLMSVWSDAGLSDGSVSGGFGADPIGTLARSGRLPQGIDRALADAAGLASMAAGRYPLVRTWTVDATVYAEAGCGEAQELAAMLSTTVAYLRSMQDAGMDARSAAASIEIVLGADPDFFTTIAKLRAARRVHAAMVGECGIDPAADPVRFVVRTLRRNLSRRDPWVNLLRVTSGGFAAALGGADTVLTTPFDSVLGRPGALGRRMARNTQLLLAEESNVGRVIDPAGGSWYVESLTEAIAVEAWKVFTELEGAGGLPAVLVDGTLAARIAEVCSVRFEDVATRKAPMTGVSEFPKLDEQLPDTAPLVGGSAAAAEETEAATRCEPLETVRWAEPFEALRDAADAARAASVGGSEGGRGSGSGGSGGGAGPPRVFLVNLGDVATHTARAAWAQNVFAAGGIEAVSSQRGTTNGFSTPAEAAEDFAADPARIACVCSSDETYADLGAAAARALVAAGAQRVYLAGRPGELRGDLESAGVDEFIHVGVDLVEVLGRAHELLGIEPAGDKEGDKEKEAGR